MIHFLQTRTEALLEDARMKAFEGDTVNIVCTTPALAYYTMCEFLRLFDAVEGRNSRRECRIPGTSHPVRFYSCIDCAKGLRGIVLFHASLTDQEDWETFPVLADWFAVQP